MALDLTGDHKIITCDAGSIAICGHRVFEMSGTYIGDLDNPDAIFKDKELMKRDGNFIIEAIRSKIKAKTAKPVEVEKAPAEELPVLEAPKKRGRPPKIVEE